MKRTISLLLSLLLCLLLLPDQGRAADVPESMKPPVIVATAESEVPKELALMMDEQPNEAEVGHY